MLEIRKTAVSLDERDIIELERIVTDNDEKEALRFIKKVSLRPYYAFTAGRT